MKPKKKVPSSKGSWWLRRKNIWCSILHRWKTGHLEHTDIRFTDGKVHYSICRECNRDLRWEKRHG